MKRKGAAVPTRANIRRLRVCAGVAALLVGATVALTGCTVPAAPIVPSTPVQDAGVTRIVRQAVAAHNLRSAIVEVVRDGRVVSQEAFGQSLTGQPATTSMHFRNGAVAFSYVTTLLMKDVDAHKLRLDDTIDRWEPSLPDANTVTLRMLANQTSGYPDFETDPAWNTAFNADPFHVFTYAERLRYAFSRPMLFAPGTNWSYAHTNFMVLGDILAKVGGKPLDTLLSDQVLKPMGLTATAGSDTSAVPSPVLHSYSSERRASLQIPAGVPFSEEATYWNTQWGTPMGANETTTIADLARTAVEVGSGALLTSRSYHTMVDARLIGFGSRQPDCEPSCFQQTTRYSYGLGVVRSGDWILQNPSLSGQSATEAYLPAQKLAIAVVVTFTPAAFDASGGYQHYQSTQLFQQLGAYLAPDDAPPA